MLLCTLLPTTHLIPRSLSALQGFDCHKDGQRVREITRPPIRERFLRVIHVGVLQKRQL